jgi:hypothetical protein
VSFTIKRGPIAADNFTIISNALLRDAALSFKARGMAAWLLGHREDFNLTMVRIAQMNACGEAGVRTAVKELEDAGYLVREQVRAGESGQFGETVYHLTDSPESPGEDRRAVSHGRVSREREIEAHKKTTSKKITSKAPDADAPEGQQGLDLGVASEPPVIEDKTAEKPRTVNQRAVLLAQAHYDRLGKMGNVPAMAKIIRKALEREFTDARVNETLVWLADRRWTLTEERLANALRGGPLPAGRTAPAAAPKARTGRMELEY